MSLLSGLESLPTFHAAEALLGKPGLVMLGGAVGLYWRAFQRQ